MRERLYESGNCVQRICAILGVHLKDFRPTKGRIKWRVWLVSDTNSGIYKFLRSTYEREGREFESLRARHFSPINCGI